METGRTPSSPTKLGHPIEINKVLMKGRQIGGQDTPKGSKPINFDNNFKILKYTKHASPPREKHESSLSVKSKRNDSVEFERESKVASFMKDTRRKNSVRRQFFLLKDGKNL